MPKLLMAGSHPHQNIAPLFDISGSLQIIFHSTHKQVPWTTLQPCFFAVPIPLLRVSCSLLVLCFPVLGEDAVLSMIPSPSVSSYAMYMKSLQALFCFQYSLHWINDVFLVEMWRSSFFPQYELEAYGGHWFIAISVP